MHVLLKVPPLKIAAAQLNPIVGDISGNVKLVREAADRAACDGADLLVVSELLVSGYPPKDLLLREGFVAACDRAVEELAQQLAGKIAVLVGHPTCWNVPDGRIANAASLLDEGRVLATIHKTLLPNYDVFDERRYFHPNPDPNPMEFRGRKLGVHICEDAWWGQPDTFHHHEPQHSDPVESLANAGAELLINLSASPFEINKPGRRIGILATHAKRHQLPVIFVNQVGGNDDLVFDGRSLTVNSDGKLIAQLAGFEENFRVIDLEETSSPCDDAELTPAARESDLLDALVLGLRDYMRKCGFSDCVLGLSGGIDSAVAAYIAAEAVGPEHVHGILMPSRYSSPHSIEDARILAENLGIDHCVIPIDEIHRAYEAADVVKEDLASQPAGLADQNLQARIRGALVMIRSNRHGWMALATGNKSELAVGYCTLYGDMAGGFAVLSDVLKRDVYGIARYINTTRAGRELIPEHIITKAPSAELAPDQYDQDVLPPYDILDGILAGLIEREDSVQTLSKTYPPETVRWVAQRLDRNEFKRRQMPPGIKLSTRAFGSGRRMPMAARTDVT
ncbi:MAG: NAD+ synthase [Planctomycetaceae bacterium]